MVTTTAIVKLSDRANQVVNIVKAKYDLRDKSAALNKLIAEYEDEVLDRALKPSLIKKIQKIEKNGKFVRINALEDLWK